MNYTKPQVSTLGDAATVIENILNQKPVMRPFEVGRTVSIPAYDLDE
jgi:hypothetical protein